MSTTVTVTGSSKRRYYSIIQCERQAVINEQNLFDVQVFLYSTQYTHGSGLMRVRELIQNSATLYRIIVFRKVVVSDFQRKFSDNENMPRHWIKRDLRINRYFSVFDLCPYMLKLYYRIIAAVTNRKLRR